MSGLLDVAGLRAGYGDIEVLRGVDLHVDDGEIVALLGANGAGKSTLLGALTGLVEIGGGDATFGGTSLRRQRADAIVGLGIAHVPQNRRLFGQMSVLDNLLMGAYRRTDGEASADLERVFDLFPRLRERRAQMAGTLSGGEQQMCAIGRALMSKPRLLLVDELSLGLAPIVIEQLLAVLVSLRAAGTPVMLVEQDVLVALEIADRAYVIETGRVAMSGPARTLADDPHIKTAYLGM